ncbi:FAD/NAD(P)-binding domain-containing protein [Gonapodya prolifera JEL478]|uniref:FAD/NAD(P)-binding domain-containing protein n=1 Tax=Gonapodya prolifera (strain JEL478) TaxID=1344416 RepID=A0A139AZP2_GONPJ|nr:FAD/NAD(P)-binding domain-containing protein [Gonapodya prolifera JEL478]|eukprot:KXS22174.1 FAD/NAD(P)-binding domain-containing protein [Gonapodya prolifera JEL478]
MFFHSKHSSLLSLRVIIIGAGPAGLTLARILQTRGAENVTVIERDVDRYHRPQGGSLDLHNESGQAALRAAGLHAEFMKLARPEGEDMKITDKHFSILHSEVSTTPPGPSPIFGTMFTRPEIDRTQLRDLLIDSLEPGTIRWGTEVVDIMEDPQGASAGPYVVRVRPKVASGDSGATARASDGRDGLALPQDNSGLEHLYADLIVGTDGAWSRTRSLLTPVKPTYSGISFYDITIDNADTTPLTSSPDYPTVGALVGRGMLISLEHGRGMFAQRNSGGRVRIYANFAVPAEFLDMPENSLEGKSDIKAVNAHIASLFPDWSPTLLELIAANTNPVTPRKIYALPVGHSWSRPPTQPGSAPRAAMITLVGDAAHVMSPFAGEGVNQAMADSMSLADHLSWAKYDGQLERAVVEFERAMFQRVEPIARETSDNLVMFFLTEDTPRSLVNMMKQYESWWFLTKYMAGKVVQGVFGAKH